MEIENVFTGKNSLDTTLRKEINQQSLQSRRLNNLALA